MQSIIADVRALNERVEDLEQVYHTTAVAAGVRLDQLLALVAASPQLPKALDRMPMESQSTSDSETGDTFMSAVIGTVSSNSDAGEESADQANRQLEASIEQSLLVTHGPVIPDTLKENLETMVERMRKTLVHPPMTSAAEDDFNGRQRTVSDVTLDFCTPLLVTPRPNRRLSPGPCPVGMEADACGNSLEVAARKEQSSFHGCGSAGQTPKSATVLSGRLGSPQVVRHETTPTPQSLQSIRADLKDCLGEMRKESGESLLPPMANAVDHGRRVITPARLTSGCARNVVPAHHQQPIVVTACPQGGSFTVMQPNAHTGIGNPSLMACSVMPPAHSSHGCPTVVRQVSALGGAGLLRNMTPAKQRTISPCRGSPPQPMPFQQQQPPPGHLQL